MGLSLSRPKRQKPKSSDKPLRSSGNVDETGSISSAISFQDRLWSKTSKQPIRREFCRCNDTPDYATLRTVVAVEPSKSNPVYINMNPKNGICCIHKSEDNEAPENFDSSVKPSQTGFPLDSTTSNNGNHYRDDCNTSCRPKPHRLSSISSVFTKLPPLPEPDEAEKEKVNGKECKETVSYSTVKHKGPDNEYAMTTCIERPDPLHNAHAYTWINHTCTSCGRVTDNETTEKGYTIEGLEMQENGCKDRTVLSEATTQFGSGGRHTAEEETSPGIVSRDPGSDAVTHGMPMPENNPSDPDYEPCLDRYGLGRTASYKYGKLLMNQTPKVARHSVTPITNLPPASQPLIPLTTIPTASQPQPLHPLQNPIVQSVHLPSVHPVQIPPLQPNSISNHQMHTGSYTYRVCAGTQQRLPLMTVSVPPRIDSGSSHVELKWSYILEEFPVLTPSQRPLTNVLHCLPHGSTFSSPVVISLDLPLTEGQIEIFYNQADVGKIPIWTKLNAIDAPANTFFTDDREPHANKVLLLLKNRHQAVLALRHLCSFIIVENRNVERSRKAEVAIFLKTKAIGQDSWIAIFKVAVGCDKNNMRRSFQALKDDGFRLVEQTEFLLYKTESDSGLKVGIRDIEWMVGCMQKHSITSRVHGLDCLWNSIEATSLFWMKSKGSEPNEEQLSCTVYVHQEGRREKTVGIYRDMAKELRMPSRPKRTIAATRSSPELLASVNLRTESDARNSTSDSDLNLATEDLCSHRLDEVVLDSDQDFALNCYVRGKAVMHEAESTSKMFSKRAHSVENMDHAGIYQDGPVSSLAKSLTHVAYSVEDINRITTIVGGTVITQLELDWILAA